MPEHARRLATYCRERIGEQLRVVGAYTPAPEVLYVREDLRNEYSEDDIRAMARTAARVSDDLRVFGREDVPLDQYFGTVHTFDRALAMQFVHGDDRGVIVTVEHDVGPRLVGFLRECTEVLNREETPTEPNPWARSDDD